ncbi:sigma-70 family RNA polymerase sigma factor [Fodinicola feengrottensis]|uniref:RNA polymerase sigma factor n=1 Tax=Fodinicola feengrottensis TaxID=435914 RepID=A0ABN2H650_9ACTN
MSQPGNEEFVRRTETFRRELLAHCYRMIGSVSDAEDVVQETYLRAWRSYDRFQDRSSIRTWLYRIATNTCLTALRNRGRRALPSGLGAPSDDPYEPTELAGPQVSWLQPIPDALLNPDPADVVVSRDSIRLALIASLQYLPPRQRAVLLLRDVLAWSAAEVAEALDTTTTAVKSTLQRARARLDEVAPAPDTVAEPTAPQARALLDAYMAAFENSDAAALEKLLRADSTLEMTPSRTWFAGLRTCMPFFVASALGAPGDWRMVPTSANGQPAAAAYQRGTDGAYRAFGVAVLTLSSTHIARITLFIDPDLVVAFGEPPVFEAS